MTREEYINQYTDEEKIEKMNNLLGEWYDDIVEFEKRMGNQSETISRGTPLNFDEIEKLRQGRRIVNILYSDTWGAKYSFSHNDSFGQPRYTIRTVEDLKKITKRDFLMQRNAGKLTWEILDEYRKGLKI